MCAAPHNVRPLGVKVMTNVLIAIAVGVLVVLIVRGLWRATAVQKGTGCPCCDKALGVGDGHGHAEAHKHGKAGHDHAKS